MKYEATLSDYMLGISDLPDNLQRASANLQNIIMQWGEMPEGPDENMIRDMIIKTDDFLNENIQQLINAGKITIYINNRILKHEVRYLNINN